MDDRVGSRGARRRALAVLATLALLASASWAVGAGAANGVVDDAWGDNGYVFPDLPPGANTSQFLDAVVTPSGATWAAESSRNTSGGATAYRLLRLDPQGVLVGSVPLDAPSGSLPTARLVADGEAVYAVNVHNNETGSVRRVLPDLTLDPTFSGDGVLEFADDELGLPGAAGCTSNFINLCPGPTGGAAVDTAGRLVLTVGTMVVRVLPEGVLDPSFGTDGHVTVGQPNGSARVLLDDAEHITVVQVDGTVRRLLPNGSPDSSFGADLSGVVSQSEFSCDLFAFASGCPVAFDAAGNLYIGGKAGAGVTFTNSTGVRGIGRLSADGTESEFHPLACAVGPESSLSCTVNDLVVDDTGQLHHFAGSAVRTAALPLEPGVLGGAPRGVWNAFSKLRLTTDPGVILVAGGAQVPPSSGIRAVAVKVRVDQPPIPVSGSLSPPSRTVEQGVSVPVTFSCSVEFPLPCEGLLVSGPVPDPVPPLEELGPTTPIASGDPLPWTFDGDVRTLLVRTADLSTGQLVYVARADYTMVEPASVFASAPPGGTVSTGDEPTVDDPLTVGVRTPSGGGVFIDEQFVGGSEWGDFSVFGYSVYIEAPEETPEAPLELTFSIHPSQTGGTAASAMVLWRNGTLVPDCVPAVGATVAQPDPCVSSRVDLADGSVRLTALTSQASTWTLGRFDGDLSPVVSVGDQSGLERDSATGSVFVPVYLSRPAEEPVTVSFHTLDGTAQAGTDYVRWGTPANPRTVTVPAGSLQGQINVPILPDDQVEPDETFEVVLSSVSGGDAVIGRDTATATIVDSDDLAGPNPVLTVSNPTVVEGDDGRRRAQFQIHLSRALGSNLTVTYATSDDDAVAGVDYVAKLPGTVVFQPGQISRTIDVLVESDLDRQGDRQFFLDVTVVGGTPVEEKTMTGVARILDDD